MILAEQYLEWVADCFRKLYQMRKGWPWLKYTLASDFWYDFDEEADHA